MEQLEEYMVVVKVLILVQLLLLKLKVVQLLMKYLVDLIQQVRYQ